MSIFFKKTKIMKGDYCHQFIKVAELKTGIA